MKVGETIFVFGKAPKENSPFLLSRSHPCDKSAMVRFVKFGKTASLYVNISDFIKPYTDKKEKYENVIRKIMPRRHKDLELVWISVAAWEEIKKGIDSGNSKDIVKKWKERLLF